MNFPLFTCDGLLLAFLLRGDVAPLSVHSTPPSLSSPIFKTLSFMKVTMCESVCSIDFTPKILPPCSDRECAVLSNSVAELEDWGEEQLVIMRCLLLEEREEENRRHAVQSRTLTCRREDKWSIQVSPSSFPPHSHRAAACGLWWLWAR